MKLIYAVDAERDLGGLFAYISDELQNPLAAQNVIVRLLQLTNRLAAFPALGVELESADLRLKGYRRLAVSDYLIIYKIVGDEVIVMRVLYGRSDYLQLLLG